MALGRGTGDSAVAVWAHRPPVWVYLLIIAAGLVEPLTHVWIASIAREDAVFSGLHTPDSAIFLHSMAMFDSGHYTPYATCRTENGANDPALYPAPFHWMYGLVGAAGAAVGAKPFIWLGIVNGFGLAAYLAAVYAFLRRTVPSLLDSAFLMFVLAGGLGGIAYVVALLTGATSAPAFDTNFHRLAIYELLEGPGLNPLLYGPRLYYTLSMALAFAALTAWRTAEESRCRRHHAFATFLLLCAAIINARFAGMAWLVAVCFLLTDPGPWRGRALRALWLFVSVAMGLATTSLAVARHPVFAENSAALVRQGLWLSAFLTAAGARLLLTPFALKPAWLGLPSLARVLASAATGYLIAFVLLYVAFHAWHGTLWPPLDHGALVFAADPALLGALAGGLWGWRSRSEIVMNTHMLSPFLLWFGAFLALSVAGVGQGWALQFTPQRFLVFIGVPLSVLAAYGVSVLAQWRPLLARTVWVAVIGSGLCSAIGGALFFQGPLGRGAGNGPFAAWHAEIIHPDDAVLLEWLPQETVIAPGWYADVAGIRPGARVLGGFGMADLSDAPSTLVQPLINDLFFGKLSPEDAAEFFERWCIGYVWAPAKFDPPFNAAGYPQLRAYMRAGDSILYVVEP